jgi:hypothetical protein
MSVGDLIADRRVRNVPCCYCETAGCCELVSHQVRGGAQIQRVLCTVRDRTFRRV